MLYGQMTWQIVANCPAPVTGWLSPQGYISLSISTVRKTLVGGLCHPSRDAVKYATTD